MGVKWRSVKNRSVTESRFSVNNNLIIDNTIMHFPSNVDLIKIFFRKTIDTVIRDLKDFLQLPLHINRSAINTKF